MPVRRVGVERGRAGGPYGIGPERLSDDVTKRRYCFENFMQEPLNTKAGILLAPGGTALQACLIFTGNYTFQWATTADETDQFYPTLATDGGYNFQIANTPVLADGVEINFGGDIVGHPRNWTPSSEDFFARVLINLTDASGGDVVFGVKKAAATVATLTEITDLFAIRSLGNSASSDTAWSVLTNLNNAGATDYTSTSVSLTGLEDLTAVELEVRSVAGKGFLFVNGVPVPGAPAFTFDTGDNVSPILRFAQTTDTTAAYKVFAYESGPIEARRPESLLTLAQATA